MRYLIISFILLSTLLNPLKSSSQIVKPESIFSKFTFWHNQDWDWYKSNIPFFESPDKEMDKTYYYRWDMLTSHLVYGSPKTGYTFTEFIDRPWWSARYGSISCAAGHQLYEVRWLRDQNYAKDYANYWFKTEGTNVRNYTTWLGDAIWNSYKVNYDKSVILGLKNDLIANYKGWEKDRWVESEQMFAWDGMHDGMETNINSRQTKQWFDGAPGYRPTLNSYMWADAKAIAAISALDGDSNNEKEYLAKAEIIKTNFQKKNWDPKREFFFHRYLKDEDGGIKANTLTYETGKFAGSKHGREEIGFIPWYFNMPDAGYESAFKFLMDSSYFYSPYGPRTVEKLDPMFNIAARCCAWSGNAWPFATSQTLKAMANVIKYYHQPYVTKSDYVKQLHIFSITHRKDNEPFIGEGNHPETGSWSGHDYVGHSEHYFHSTFVDEIITGLMGFTPKETDSIEVNPLLPEAWDYAAIDNIAYHGHNIAIVWDKYGTKYKKGKGLLVFSDGKIIARAASITKLTAKLLPKVIPTNEKRMVNYAVNNEHNVYYPHAEASFPGIGNQNAVKLNDGQYWYYTTTPNRWSSLYARQEPQWIAVDFGTKRTISTIRIYLTADSGIKIPVSIVPQYWNGNTWATVPGQIPLTKLSLNRATTISFPALRTSKIRVLLNSQKESAVAVSELETWGPQETEIEKPTGVIRKSSHLGSSDLADVTASFTSKFDNVAAINDAVINPIERWTAFESPNETDDITFNFKKTTTLNTAYIYFFSDKGGIQPPAEYHSEYWADGKWIALNNVKKSPAGAAIEGLNILSFKNITTDKIKFVFTHKNKKTFTGSYEIELLNQP